jgi:hypothetical protein
MDENLSTSKWGKFNQSKCLEKSLKVDEIHSMGKFWYGMNCRQNGQKFIPLTHLLDGGKNLLLSLLLNLWKVDEIQPR